MEENSENTVHVRSSEEEDNLIRTKKKFKPSVENRDENMVDRGDEKHDGLPKASFRDTLMGKLGNKGFNEADDFGPITENEGLLKITTKESWPCIETSEKLRESLDRKWKNCLIVKLLGRNVGYKTLYEKIKKLWMPREEIDLIDLREGHFLVRFYDTSDLAFALEEGPWMIFGHYLTVRVWDPAIDPTNASIESTTVWVRFPGISVRYYDDRILFAMSNTLGRALKVDQNTRYASRGQFARVCVEVDLKQPLVPKVCLDGVWYNVEYEGLHLICFHCGRVGHKTCPFKVVTDKVQESENQKDHSVSRKENLIGEENTVVKRSEFGVWMMASSRNFRKPLQAGAQDKGKGVGSDFKQAGSRFAALSEIVEEGEFGGKSFENVKTSPANPGFKYIKKSLNVGRVPPKSDKINVDKPTDKPALGRPAVPNDKPKPMNSMAHVNSHSLPGNGSRVKETMDPNSLKNNTEEGVNGKSSMEEDGDNNMLIDLSRSQNLDGDHRNREPPDDEMDTDVPETPLDRLAAAHASEEMETILGGCTTSGTSNMFL